MKNIENLCKICAPFLIVIFGVIIYSNSFDCSFHFDDISNITENTSIQDITNLHEIWSYGYHPRFVGNLTFALNYYFNRTDVFGYHLVNLSIHIITSIVVWMLIRLLLSTPAMLKGNIRLHKEFLALATGLIFLVHPIQTQAITYIVQRLASLAGLFYFTSIYLYLEARLLTHNKISILFLFGSLLSAILGMLTKETVFTLPFSILFTELLFIQTDSLGVIIKKRFIHILLFSAIILALIIPALYDFDVKDVLKPIVSQREGDPLLTLPIYVFTQFRVISNYIILLILPLRQNLDHDIPASTSFFEPYTFLSFLFLMGIFISGVYLLRKGKRLHAFGIFWFFLTLSVESFRPLRNVMFEHRLYIPMFGFCIILSNLWHYFLKKYGFLVTTIFLTLLIVTYSILTYQRNMIWKDDYTLWSDVVKKSPMKSRPYNKLGDYFYKRGALLDAKRNFQRALKLDASNIIALNNTGLILYMEDDIDGAIRKWELAIRIDPENIEGYYNLGTSFYVKGEIEKSIDMLNEVIKLDSTSVKAYYNLGLAMDRAGKTDDAIKVYKTVINLDPSLINAYYNLGLLLQKNQEYIEASKMYKQILVINADHSSALSRLNDCIKLISTINKENE